MSSNRAHASLRQQPTLLKVLPRSIRRSGGLAELGTQLQCLHLRGGQRLRPLLQLLLQILRGRQLSQEHNEKHV